MNLINPLNTELNPICHLLALLGAHHFLHVSKIRVKQDLYSSEKLLSLWWQNLCCRLSGFTTHHICEL